MSPGRQGEPGRVTGSRDFVRFWVADGVSNLGTFVSTLALQLLLIDTLHADQRAIGLVRSAQWLPYLLFGLLAGVVVDRVRRRPLLVVADLVSAALLGAVGLLALTGRLSVPLLAGLVFLSGSASMFFVAAHQSYLPALVPLRLLPTASARLEQTWTAAQSVGPLVGGVLVRLLSAPVAVLVDAMTYAVSAVLLATIRTREPAPERPVGPTSARPGAAAAVGRVVDDLREGARWVYRHEMLAPYAVALHLWFFFNAVVTTVFVYFAATELGLDAVSIGIALAATGLTGVVGAGLAPRLGERFGLGRVVTASEWLSPAAYALLLLARAGPDGTAVARRGQPRLRPGARAQGTPRGQLPHRRHAGAAAGPDERDDPVVQLGLDRRRRTAGGARSGGVGQPADDRHRGRRPARRRAAAQRLRLPPGRAAGHSAERRACFHDTRPPVCMSERR